MAWVKYEKNDLINLDKNTDIYIEKVQNKKDDYVFIRTSHEGRKLLKMYAAKHNITMLEAVAVLAKEALEREEKKGC